MYADDLKLQVANVFTYQHMQHTLTQRDGSLSRKKTRCTGYNEILLSISHAPLLQLRLGDESVFQEPWENRLAVLC